jgi:DNA-binding GntR family transcriptional regulator
MLVTLALKPGEAVREKHLADAVGLGRTPVREAVQRLAGMGLLRVMPRKGLQVAQVQHDELQQVIEARRVLERLLVVKACERADAAQRIAFERLSAQLQPAPARLQLDEFYRLDEQLNQLLGEAVNNPYLLDALAPLQVHCRRFWSLRFKPQHLPGASARHAALAAAVADADSAGAVRAVNGIIGDLEARLQTV